MARPDNAASIHVLEKLGMRALGSTTHRGHAMIKFELLAAQRVRNTEA
jgi:RimJ/RimL family protein N-acetyltransferase